LKRFYCSAPATAHAVISSLYVNNNRLLELAEQHCAYPQQQKQQPNVATASYSSLEMTPSSSSNSSAQQLRSSSVGNK
jgi:hypothetical protein